MRVFSRVCEVDFQPTTIYFPAFHIYLRKYPWEKSLYAELNGNETEVFSLFLVRISDIRIKHGEQFVHWTIADRTGILEYKAYGDKAAEAARAMKTGMVCAIPGVGKTNQNGKLYVFFDSPDTLDFTAHGACFPQTNVGNRGPPHTSRHQR
ncbi:MAG: hypothetical protein LBU24_01835 [Methanocalculaceae archaeon]|jgi:hypothetical protein|nr:hypothetical protein [Methanocalculaceae archaeon]